MGEKAQRIARFEMSLWRVTAMVMSLASGHGNCGVKGRADR
jgi:hypothetical protein